MNDMAYTPKPHILVVDDDSRLRELLTAYLRDQGFAVTAAIHAGDAERKLALFQFDLIVLDVMMPGETGTQFLKRENGRLPPVLLLTAMTGTDDRIGGLEAGADDYLAKPFEPRELVLRLQAILRRTAREETRKTLVTFGAYQFDPAQNRLLKDGEPFALTSGESQLLRTLAEKAGEPVSREDLARAMGVEASERTIDVQITRLRKKIEPSADRPAFIQTVRGAGYVLYAERGGMA
jgi:two-component system phosphate regulon response regulator OmpR